MGIRAFEGVHKPENLDAFYSFHNAEAGGAVVNFTPDSMTADPQTDVEGGFIRILINGTAYQIPIYAE